MKHLFAPRHSTLLPLLVCLVLLPCRVLQAQDEPIGTVIFRFGSVTAVSASGDERVLERRARVYRGDLISTGPDGMADIYMVDGARLSLRPGTEFEFSDFAWDGDDGAGDSAIMTLIRGGFRTMSGSIGESEGDEYQVLTSFANIGIRGTSHEAVIDPDRNALYTGVSEGGTTVANAAGSLDLGVGAGFDFSETLPGQPPRGLLAVPEPLARYDLAALPAAQAGGPASEEEQSTQAPTALAQNAPAQNAQAQTAQAEDTAPEDDASPGGGNAIAAAPAAAPAQAANRDAVPPAAPAASDSRLLPRALALNGDSEGPSSPASQTPAVRESPSASSTSLATSAATAGPETAAASPPVAASSSPSMENPAGANRSGDPSGGISSAAGAAVTQVASVLQDAPGRTRAPARQNANGGVAQASGARTAPEFADGRGRGSPPSAALGTGALPGGESASGNGRGREASSGPENLLRDTIDVAADLIPRGRGTLASRPEHRPAGPAQVQAEITGDDTEALINPTQNSRGLLSLAGGPNGNGNGKGGGRGGKDKDGSDEKAVDEEEEGKDKQPLGKLGRSRIRTLLAGGDSGLAGEEEQGGAPFQSPNARDLQALHPTSPALLTAAGASVTLDGGTADSSSDARPDSDFDVSWGFWNSGQPVIHSANTSGALTPARELAFWAQVLPADMAELRQLSAHWRFSLERGQGRFIGAGSAGELNALDMAFDVDLGSGLITGGSFRAEAGTQQVWQLDFSGQVEGAAARMHSFRNAVISDSTGTPIGRVDGEIGGIFTGDTGNAGFVSGFSLTGGGGEYLNGFGLLGGAVE